MNFNIDYQDENEMNTFTINTPEVANWAVKKIKEERSRRDLFLAAAESEIDNLKFLADEEKKSCDNKTRFLMYKLDDYLNAAPAKETKTMRKLKLPAGELVRKVPAPDYKKDDEILLKYLKENSAEFVKSVESPKWTDFKKLLDINGDNVVRTDTGEILDCISVEEKPAVFDVK